MAAVRLESRSRFVCSTFFSIVRLFVLISCGCVSDWMDAAGENDSANEVGLRAARFLATRRRELPPSHT